MATIVWNCPRCRSVKMTFDVLQSVALAMRYGWQHRYEVFAACRNCNTSTVFVISESTESNREYVKQHSPETMRNLNEDFRVDGYICLKDMGVASPPDFVPETIGNAFREGGTSVATSCPNAAASMFRLVVDLSTRPLLPKDEAAGRPNNKTCRDLGLRLPWLFANGYLPRDLEELSRCIREDGNDGAHAGTLTMPDALDLQDFARALLERMFTEPARLEQARERRDKRRAQPAGNG